MVLKNSRRLRVHVSCGESTGELASQSKHVRRGNSCPDVYRGDSADCWYNSANTRTHVSNIIELVQTAVVCYVRNKLQIA